MYVIEISKQINEINKEALEYNQKNKSDYDKRLQFLQKDIDRCEDYKNKIGQLEIDIKSDF